MVRLGIWTCESRFEDWSRGNTEMRSYLQNTGQFNKWWSHLDNVQNLGQRDKWVFALVAQSCPTLCDPWTAVHQGGLLCPWVFPGKDTGMGCHFLLQGIFPTQGSNLGLLHCREILYWLGYKGSSQGVKR